MFKRLLRFVGNNFITGIVVILPLVVTVVILRYMILKLNIALLNPLSHYLAPYLAAEQPRILLAKTLIFITVVLLIIIIGLATRIFSIRKTFLIFEKILYHVPMINKIYGTTKEISNAFLGKQKGVFKRVILVEYPRKGIYSVAFVTSELNQEPSDKAKKDLISAYIPTVPNPTSGIFLLVPKDEAIPLDMSVEEGLKMVISAGIIHKTK